MLKDTDVTILLPVFNRFEYTKNWLDFAESQKNPFLIYICDGGNIKNLDKKLNLKNRKINIYYKKYKFYKNYKMIFEKYYLAIKNIKSKYVFLAEDDDYISINSIRKSAKFLNNHKEFSCAKGINCLGDFIESKKKFYSFVLRNENENKIDKSLTADQADDRLIQFFKNKNVTVFNGLFTRESLKKTFKILGKRDFYNLYITELILCLKIVNEGKIKRLNQIDYIKMDNTEFSSSNNFTKLRPFSRIVLSKNFKIENDLIFEHLDFKNKDKLILFKKLYKDFINRDKRLRLIDEKKKHSLSKIFITTTKKLLIFFGLFSRLKLIKYKFKSKITNREIMIINENLIQATNKEIKFFKELINFRTNLKKKL
jgi:glycosyltransferase domain-containing protein